MNAPKNKQADHAVRFINNLCLTGDFYGEQMKLRPWQEVIVRRLFGTLDKKQRRIVRRTLLLLPRKCGKTALAASICLLCLLSFGRNQVILAAAASQKQASHVYDAMVCMIRQDPFLSSICEIIKSEKRIAVIGTNSYFVAVTSGSESAHGHNPTVVVIDELHAWTKPKHRELFTALTTGRGGRREPLTIMISTQTSNMFSLAGEEISYARQLKGRIENGETRTDGVFDNPEYLSVIYCADPEDDWTDEKVWHRVCPALGDYCSIEEYRDQFRMARDIPSRATAFKVLYLNMPAAEEGRWLDMSLWNACKGKVEPPDNAECYAALDLAPVNDLTALTLLFPIEDKLHVLPFFWCNEADILKRSRVEKVPYNVWREKDYIKATSGSSTDFQVVVADIIKLSKKYRIKLLVADKTYAYQPGQELAAAGIRIEWFQQGFLSFGPAVARTEKLLLDGALVHPGNPVLDYCFSNVRCERDAADNLKPSNKLRQRNERIDGAVSTIMSVGAWLGEQSKRPSGYEKGVCVV